ncbi:zinc finger containing protein [Stemphylium lycopersici]|nr:hypothetical protein TW65_06867 [Stemphylium lycopersici]RAQ99954.1 zinc finger containing protein [Stemphylium lycopersici]
MPPPKTIFTSYERNSLKDRWGSQATRLTRDSFLPFGSCQLCLLPSVDPVCCPQGDLFCRECAMTNLLAQRKEMKRLEKVNERQKLEDEDQKLREEEEARLRAVEEFEAVQQGLSVKAGASARMIGREGGKIMVEEEQYVKAGESKGTKRKFEIDEEELKRIASEEQRKAKRSLDEERKAAKGHLPSFWVPGETPDQHHKNAEKAKLTPVCPSSSPDQPHNLSLKGLTSVNFHEEKSTDTGKTARTCPSCQKALSNSTKAVLAIPCGHVLCKPCVDKFLKPEHRHQRDAHDDGPDPETTHCYVCDADLTTVPDAKEGKRKKDKEKAPKPGLVEIRSEGTGFASGGKAMVKREGVAFQPNSLSPSNFLDPERQAALAPTLPHLFQLKNTLNRSSRRLPNQPHHMLNMADSTLTELQRTTARMLDDWIVDPEILIQNCPLDHGRHEIKPKHGLGSLHSLPAELQQHILGFVDIKTLFALRSVMKHAPNSIRMAIGIQTAHTFNIKELFTKLCERTCGEIGCEKLAAYVNVFTLSRHCLFIGGDCSCPHGPVSEDRLAISRMDQKAISSLPSFYAIIGRYSEYWGRPLEVHSEGRRFYDYHDIYDECLNDDTAWDFWEFERDYHHEDDWSLPRM